MVERYVQCKPNLLNRNLIPPPLFFGGGKQYRLKRCARRETGSRMQWKKTVGKAAAGYS